MEKAIAVSVTVERGSPGSVDELADLCEAAGLKVVEKLTFRQREIFAAQFLGKGKVEKVAEFAKKAKVDVVVFENDLSGSQQRNIEEIVSAKTIDRTQLILDIFAQRARSNEGKLQVELAQLKYLLPRLSGKGIYLSRLGGGIGTRGPGEQKLEMDRRHIRERITKLSRELDHMQDRRSVNIEKKKEKDLPLVALVGYTNAGKSTLFNRLTDASVLVKDQLFSTLDTTTRIVEIRKGERFLISDTVGFIRSLPHHLVESFKATLEETLHADILLHVMDASRPDALTLERAVVDVLTQLGAQKKPLLRILNKADAISADEKQILECSGGVVVSALTGEGADRVLGELQKRLFKHRREADIFIPNAKAHLLDFIYKEAVVVTRKDAPGGSHFRLLISPRGESILRSKLLLTS